MLGNLDRIQTPIRSRLGGGFFTADTCIYTDIMYNEDTR